ncbi:MAG: hypothetical protein R2873_10775 [Caldilineaceae bacterium]
MTSNTIRLTTAQAVVNFLKNQYVTRDGVEQRFFAGCFGIFGHGNVAGLGQALMQTKDFRYYQTRTNRRWSTRRRPLPSTRIACRRWPAPRRLDRGPRT